MKNKYLFSLGLMGMLTPISMMLWVWRIVSVEALASLVPHPIKLYTLIGGILISVAFAALTIYFTIQSRKECEHCGVSMERQIIQAEKLATVGQLAGGIAHEVNTPASIIAGRVEAMFLDSKNLSQSDRDDLIVIKNQAERIGQITRGLLLFAKRTPAEKTKVDLNDVVREAVALIGSQLKKAGIEIVTRYNSLPINLTAQQNQIIQVMLNLLTNARDAMPRGGKIEIETNLTNGGKSVGSISVKDHGSGISPEHLNKIFDPFFTTKKTGTGLGLSVSYGIINEHGGNIHVDTQPGQGTTFTVLLPLKSEPRKKVFHLSEVLR